MRGRFWAEEGKIYFRDAVQGSWFDALLLPRIGYFSAWNKLAALAATGVPLEQAPQVTVLAALAVQLAVLWIVQRSDAFPRPYGSLLALAVVLLAVPSEEIWLNIINSQFHFALGAALLLVTSAGALAAPFRLGFLVLAGTTGPVTAFLAPFFVGRAIRQPTPLFRAEAVLVGACALLQAGLVIQGLATGARPAAFDPWAFLAILGIKLLALPFLGMWSYGAADQLLAGTLASRVRVVVTLCGLGIMLAGVVLGHPRARLLAAMALSVAALSVAGALVVDPWTAVPPLAHGRYGYVPNALLGLGLVTVMLAPGVILWRRAVAATLLAAALLHGIEAWPRRDSLQIGPDWRAAVAAWRAGGDQTALAVWPVGWTMDLARR